MWMSSMLDLIEDIFSVQFLLTFSLSAVLMLFLTVCVFLIFRLGKPVLEIIPRMSFSAVNVIVFKYLTENIFIFLNLNSIFQT